MVYSREERPPRFYSAPSSNPPDSNNRRWIPPCSVKKDSYFNNDHERHDSVFRRVRGILNKITPEKFDKLSLELLNVGIESEIVLRGIILLIFEKALDEPKYSSLYAALCQRLCDDAPNFEPDDSKITSFRRLLLNKCQDEFENRSRATEVYDKQDGPLTVEQMETYSIAKRKMLGNIKFIGELGKLEMLHEGILHKCIKQLLEKKKNIPLSDMAEDLECLCQIMRTVGRRLDTNKAKSWMNQYFKRIQQYVQNKDLPSRINFMLQDVIDLRENGWVPRKVMTDNGPKTIHQIRQDAVKDFGVYIPAGSSGAIRNNNMNLFGSGSMHLSQPRSAMISDMLGVTPSMMSTVGMGTGPGVIHMDGFMPQYSSNMGRQRNQQNNQGFYNNYNKRSPEMNGYGGNDQSRRPQSQQQSDSRQNGGGGGMIGGGGGAGGQQQNQQQKNRSLPPRFMKQKTDSNEEISLRPAKNFTMFKPGTPSMLPMSAKTPMHNLQSAPLPSQANSDMPVPTPLMQKPQITIKHQPAQPEKNKDKKKPTLTKAECLAKMDELLSEYLQTECIEDACVTMRNMKAPKKFYPDMVALLMIKSVDKTEENRSAVSKLITGMKTDNVITCEHFMEAFSSLMDQMSDLEIDVPLVRSFVAKFAALAVTDDIVQLADLAEPMSNGAYYPLFMLCLQQIHKLKDKDWLYNVFIESKINLQSMLPEVDRNNERMMEILEDRKLSFMFPMLRVKNDLWKQIVKDPNATNLYKWIKENVDAKLHTSAEFINVLTTTILKYITKETTLADGVDVTVLPEKLIQEQEKELLSKFKVVVQKFVHDKLRLQIEVLYALQVLAYNHSFPKGLLLRMFMNLYDMEVLEEDAFLKWKEEVNNVYPGKGKALFQVNQWLMWLEQAEEEDEDSDDEEEEE
ncbi:eukaryotic translation initiation factor 4 gamma 2-like [Tubulanus polymorphus]|uniref:eukaryotic translation initiation factor 4 gamma 2-like n=1 Tax=Tubulanus polymorphus TaxID=672921 RepID=UPI003DA3A3CB